MPDALGQAIPFGHEEGALLALTLIKRGLFGAAIFLDDYWLSEAETFWLGGEIHIEDVRTLGTAFRTLPHVTKFPKGDGLTTKADEGYTTERIRHAILLVRGSSLRLPGMNISGTQIGFHRVSECLGVMYS